MEVEVWLDVIVMCLFGDESVFVIRDDVCVAR